MSEQFARLYIANLERRKKTAIELNSYEVNIICTMLDIEIDVIKEVMLEMGHIL